MGCHLPFAKPEQGTPKISNQLPGEKADTSDSAMDFDNESIDSDEEGSATEQLMKKSIQKGITPVHQYIKELTDDQYFKMIGKDAYSFLSGNKGDISMFMSVGKDVSDDFKTLNQDQVKTVYMIITDNLVNEQNWTVKEMASQLQSHFSFLEDYEAERIIKTELTRVIDYARELEAKREGENSYLYHWVGPLDYRTTPICYYLQTGQLRDSDVKLLEKHGHSPKDLPPIYEDGFLLEDLRQTVREVAECFGQEMVSDWEAHINCRHTFARSMKIEEPDLSDEEAILEAFDDAIEEADMQTAYVTDEESDVFYVNLDNGYDSLVFTNSINGKPSMYDGMTESAYVFQTEDEDTVFSTARMVEQLKQSGLTEETIIWGIQDMIGLSPEDTGYIVTNSDRIVETLKQFV